MVDMTGKPASASVRRWPGPGRRVRMALAACSVAWVCSASSAAGEGEPLKIRVTPAVAQPPAFVTVRADVAAHDDNRSLEVTAEGPDYRASSLVPLEGSKGPRFTEIYFDNLPAGQYTVTAVLNGPMGQRAQVRRSVLVGAPADAPQP